MPRATLDLQNPADLAAVGGQWKCAHGFVPGQPNEGFVSEAEGSPCRLPDYDDSGWDDCADLAAWRRRGVSFVWYRIKATLPETVGGRALDGARCLFESCIDDYGEIWINGRMRPGTRHGAGIQCAAARCSVHRAQARRRNHHRHSWR